MLDLLHHALNIVSAILILIYVVIPIAAKIGDGMAWVWRCITGNQVPKEEENSRKELLAESLAFMKNPRTRR